MDELLGAIQQRKLKINEIQEAIYQIRGNQQQERLSVYSIVRKLKEEEKIRAEKENWIIGVIRNTKQYNEEQMCHIYVKTNEMMKAISNSFLEIPYTPTCNLYGFHKFILYYTSTVNIQFYFYLNLLILIKTDQNYNILIF